MEDLIKLWDYNSGKYVRVYKGHKCRHYSIYLSFSYDGNEIISGSGIFINIYYYRRWQNNNMEYTKSKNYANIRRTY